jgi:hypothetical protein
VCVCVCVCVPKGGWSGTSVLMKYYALDYMLYNYVTQVRQQVLLRWRAIRRETHKYSVLMRLSGKTRYLCHAFYILCAMLCCGSGGKLTHTVCGCDEVGKKVCCLQCRNALYLWGIALYFMLYCFAVVILNLQIRVNIAPFLVGGTCGHQTVDLPLTSL